MASPRTVYVAGGSYPVSGVSQHVIKTVANQVPRLSHPDKGPPPEVTVSRRANCPPEDNGLL